MIGCPRQEQPWPGGRLPQALTKAFLLRCMPTVPCGYHDDFGFEQRYLDHALPALELRCIELVLGS